MSFRDVESLRTDRMIYLRVLGPLVLVIVTLMLVSIVSFHYQAASRTYVGGRVAWYNSVNQALDLLREQAHGRRLEGNCGAMDGLMMAPLGNRTARQELSKSEPDFTAVRQALLRGGNQPQDLDGMIRMYRVVRHIPAVQPVMSVWRDGDVLLDRLLAVSRKICSPNSQNTGNAQTTLREIDVLDAELVDVEKRFAEGLNTVSQSIRKTLTALVLMLGFLLTGGSVWFVMRTIHSQIRQRDQLLEANIRWNLAAEVGKIGLFVWHTTDDTVELDARARHIRGFDNDSRTTFRRADILHAVPPDDKEKIENQSAQGLPEGNRRRTRFQLQLPDGGTRHVETIAMMQPASAQQPPHMFGVVRDVTDEVAMAQLQIEKQAAEQSARTKTEFLSRLSHEMRTPLNAILGMAQVLDMDIAQPLTPQQSRRIQMIQDSGWRLLQLMDDVLDISELSSGALGVDCVSTDPCAVMQASLTVIEPERQTYGITVLNQLSAQCCQVLADPARLQQVFVNLLSNACKFNNKEGRLTLTCHDEPEHTSVCVTDEGQGMNPEQLAQLFQPFNRLKSAADVPGTGLGLLLAKLLIEQMGGTLTVSSTVGKGTSFTVRLRKA